MRTVTTRQRSADVMTFKTLGFVVATLHSVIPHRLYVVRVPGERAQSFFRKSDAYWYAVDRAMP